MSTKKKNCNIILLAEESADKIQSDRKHLILTEDKRLYNPFKNEYYNLYITCNDDLRSGACLYQKSLGFGVAKPTFGVLCFVRSASQGPGSLTTPLRNFPDTRKVIATTDKDLMRNNALLSITEHFLITYISQYSSGNIISNVDLTIGNGLIIIYEIEEHYVERQDSEVVYVPIKTTPTTFRIGGGGKFGEEKVKLNRTAAMVVYAELHKWLFPEDRKE
jgi:hypothetical protein